MTPEMHKVLVLVPVGMKHTRLCIYTHTHALVCAHTHIQTQIHNVQLSCHSTWLSCNSIYHHHYAVHKLDWFPTEQVYNSVARSRRLWYRRVSRWRILSISYTAVSGGGLDR